MMLANPQRAGRHCHLSMDRLKRHLVGTKKIRRADSRRLQCSQSSDAWKGASDAEWGNSAGQDIETSRMRNLWGSLLLASALAAAFLMARLASTSNSVRIRVYQPSGKAQMSSSSNVGNLDTNVQNSVEKEHQTKQQISKSTLSDRGTPAASAVTFSVSHDGMDHQNCAQDDNTSLHHTRLDSETTPVASTDGTKEPLLQHLFEDLEQRPADPALLKSKDMPTFDMISSSSSINVASTTSQLPSSGESKHLPGTEELADELAVKHSDIDKLGGLTGHDQLQQRAALAVRAAQAALRACESASAHSAASCRSAAEAASAANNATRAASQALTSAERGAEEDLERALRRVQHAQQQARDAEAAAATAATNAGAKATTATEQERLAQEAASLQEEQEDKNRTIVDTLQTWVVRCKTTIVVWMQAFCAWCSQAWQAFLAWTSRVGEHVQHVISRRK